jgi:hypothetical protein
MERNTMRGRQSSLQALVFLALIGITVALGPLRDSLVYAPNGAEVDHGATGSAATPPKQP